MKTRYEEACAAIESGAKPDSERLRELFQTDWDYNMREYPEEATYCGFPGQNDRWTDLSLEAIERRKRELHAPLRALLKINKEKLAPEEQLSHELFRYKCEMEIENSRFSSEYLRINHIWGLQHSLTNVLDMAPKFTLKDIADIVSRLNSFGRITEQTVVLLEKGLASGITTPKVTLGHVLTQIDNLLSAGPEESPVLEPIKDLPSSLPEAEARKLRADAQEALAAEVLPALARLKRFLSETYIPAARDTIAWSDLPGGAEWYAFTVRYLTTSRLSPREIHEAGLAEVERINTLMEETVREAGFDGSCEEFFRLLRSEPRFYYDREEDLLAGYRDLCKRVDPELIRIFGTLPRQPYGVKPVPDYMAKSQPAAFYQGGSVRAGRPGYFLVNTSELKSRPKWEMEALALHEAVPGHHLQIALAAEMESVPEFRKYSFYGAFIEGWALYAEGLGYELGLYRDVYSRFGQLASEMWRAVRLVVDTGLHAFGWSRQRAIDYFYDNAASSEHNAIVEVDRYLVLPAQALTYKIGELKIRELRQWASRTSGGSFDLRAFHDEVLRHGALPLDVLEGLIRKWAGQL